MISNLHALDSKIKDSIDRLEKIYERLRIPMTPQSFVGVIAEFGEEIESNLIFAPYKKYIIEKENSYRQEPRIRAILQQASMNPIGQQALNQKMLTRREQNSDYFSLWAVDRISKLYYMEHHDTVRAQLRAKNDIRDLMDFDLGDTVISDILEGHITENLAETYVSYAQRILCGITEFFKKQASKIDQDKNEVDNESIKVATHDQELESKDCPTTVLKNCEIKAEDLSFEKTKTGVYIKHKDKIILNLSDKKDEFIKFSSLFFPSGKLSCEKLGILSIWKKLNPEEESLLPVKTKERESYLKASGSPEYEHIRYLKDKLNKLIKNHIGLFIKLENKKCFPNPNLFQS